MCKTIICVHRQRACYFERRTTVFSIVSFVVFVDVINLRAIQRAKDARISSLWNNKNKKKFNATFISDGVKNLKRIVPGL